MALGDADAGKGTLQRCASAGEIGRLLEAFRQLLLGLATGLHCLLEVDLAGEISRLSHNHDLVRPNLQEPTRNGEELLFAGPPNPQLPKPKCRQQRRVMRENSKLALNPRANDGINLVAEHLTLRRDDLKQ
jgi:hypothetical protein